MKYFFVVLYGLVILCLVVWSGLSLFHGKNKIKYAVILFGSILAGAPMLIELGVYVTPSLAGNNETWLEFWGSYMGSTIGVIGTALFAFFNTKYQFKKEHDTKRTEAIEKVRPIITMNYRGILNEHEKIYFNASGDEVHCYEKGVSIGGTPEKIHELLGKTISLKPHEGLKQALLSINNVSKHDMYHVTMRLRYIHASTHGDTKRYIDVVEELSIPAISAKESCIIAPYLAFHGKHISMKQIEVFYTTEEMEAAFASFEIEDAGQLNANIKNIAQYLYGDQIKVEVPQKDKVRSTGYTFADESSRDSLQESKTKGSIATTSTNGTTTTTTTQASK